MKKSLLYIIAILILSQFFVSNLTFATEEAPIMQNTSVEDPYEQLKKLNAQAERIYKEREKKAYEEQKKELENATTPEEREASYEKWAKVFEEYYNQYQNTLTENQKNYLTKISELRSEYTPSIIQKPSALPGPTITTGNLERKILTTQILPRVASFIIGFAGVAALIFILLAGVQMMLSSGEEDNYNKAKERIQWAILGLLVAMLSFIAVQITINLNFEEQSTETTQTE